MPLIYFSASNNTAYVARLIAQGIEEKGLKADLIRIEDLKAGKYDLTNAKVIGIGAPIYGGFAEPIKDWVNSFDFTSKRVFLFSTAGIFHFGSTKEMIRIVERNHGKIIGAFEITFRGCMDGVVYSKKLSEKYPLKKEDLKKAIDFGNNIADIIARGVGYAESMNKHYFGAASLAIIRVIKFIVLRILKMCLYVIDSSKCISCMKCEKSCPSAAVRVNSKKPRINHHLCISCFRCFKECLQKALSLRFIGDRQYYRGPWQLEGYIDPAKIKDAIKRI